MCAIGNPYRNYSFTNIQLRFDQKDLDVVENHLEFVVFSNSTSHEVDPQKPLFLRVNVIKQAELSLRGYCIKFIKFTMLFLTFILNTFYFDYRSTRPEQVFYGSQVKVNLPVKYRDEIGSRVIHTYQVFNAGPWKVSNLEVHIDWPYQMASHFNPGKWLLYIEEKPFVEGEIFRA